MKSRAAINGTRKHIHSLAFIYQVHIWIITKSSSFYQMRYLKTPQTAATTTAAAAASWSCVFIPQSSKAQTCRSAQTNHLCLYIYVTYTYKYIDSCIFLSRCTFYWYAQMYKRAWVLEMYRFCLRVYICIYSVSYINKVACAFDGLSHGEINKTSRTTALVQEKQQQEILFQNYWLTKKYVLVSEVTLVTYVLTIYSTQGHIHIFVCVHWIKILICVTCASKMLNLNIHAHI